MHGPAAVRFSVFDVDHEGIPHAADWRAAGGRFHAWRYLRTVSVRSCPSMNEAEPSVSPMESFLTTALRAGHALYNKARTTDRIAGASGTEATERPPSSRTVRGRRRCGCRTSADGGDNNDHDDETESTGCGRCGRFHLQGVSYSCGVRIRRWAHFCAHDGSGDTATTGAMGNAGLEHHAGACPPAARPVQRAASLRTAGLAVSDASWTPAASAADGHRAARRPLQAPDSPGTSRRSNTLQPPSRSTTDVTAVMRARRHSVLCPAACIQPRPPLRATTNADAGITASRAGFDHPESAQPQRDQAAGNHGLDWADRDARWPDRAAATRSVLQGSGCCFHVVSPCSNRVQCLPKITARQGRSSRITERQCVTPNQHVARPTSHTLRVVLPSSSPHPFSPCLPTTISRSTDPAPARKIARACREHQVCNCGRRPGDKFPLRWRAPARLPGLVLERLVVHNAWRSLPSNGAS